MPAIHPANLDRICRQPIPSRTEQLELARLIRAHLDWPAADGPCPPAVRRRGIRAQQRLVEGNLRLVLAVLGRFRAAWSNKPEAYEDLFQEGVIGLTRAAEKFDPTRGYTFSTYAHRWILQSIGRSLGKTLTAVHVPEHARWHHFKVSKLITTFEAQHGHRPSLDWLIEHSGLTRDQIETCCIVGRVRLMASLDARVAGAEGEASTLLDLIASTGDQSPDVNLEQQFQIETLHKLIDRLPQSDQALVHAVCIGGETYAHHAADIGVCRETARKRGDAALKRLRRLAETEPVAA
jgi:RNA polymerase sigma factor (sigma-70 family)